MIYTPRCRAKGGPATCTNPNCPEKTATVTDFLAARARRLATQTGHPAGRKLPSADASSTTGVDPAP